MTHGALICATVRAGKSGSGVSFRAGEGVGTVTRAGLPVPPGEPAINPMPRRMIQRRHRRSRRCGGMRGRCRGRNLDPRRRSAGGETLNGRLGIVGGLSILGTTGIVVPYSCSAWIHSIHSGIDVARAAGLDACRRRDRRELGGRGAEALRLAGDGADRHGRFRRRHAEISAPPSGAARHHRRRHRQDDQAGPGPDSTCIPSAARSISRRSPDLPQRPAARRSSARASRRPTPRRKLLRLRNPKTSRSATLSRARRRRRRRASLPAATSPSRSCCSIARQNLVGRAPFS